MKPNKGPQCSRFNVMYFVISNQTSEPPTILSHFLCIQVNLFKVEHGGACL